MPSPISTDTIQSLIIEIRGGRVLLDSDVAPVYAVQTRDVNKAVANNPDKFPEGYILRLQKQEKQELVENFHQFNKLKHSPVLPNAFSEKGLYMLATILKSAKATQATFPIGHRRMGMRRGACRRQPEGAMARESDGSNERSEPGKHLPRSVNYLQRSGLSRLAGRQPSGREGGKC